MANDPFIPKNSIKLVAAMCGFALLTVTVAVLMPSQEAPAVPQDATVLAEFAFADRADGGITVTGPSGEIALEPDTNGFVRGVVRALARERRLSEIGAEHPFVLYADRNGHLGLADPETGASVNLRAFGADNARAFAALLPPQTVAGAK